MRGDLTAELRAQPGGPASSHVNSGRHLRGVAGDGWCDRVESVLLQNGLTRRAQQEVHEFRGRRRAGGILQYGRMT